MQIHFKDKEAAIAYLQQRIGRDKALLTDIKAEIEELVTQLQQRKEERSRRAWLSKMWDWDGAYTYWEEECDITDLSIRIRKVKDWITDNERLIERILSAENAEGFSVEE